MTTTKSYSISFSSALATPLDPNGFNNTYQTTLNQGLGVPANSKSCEVALVAAQIKNFDQNIRAPINKIYFKPNAIDPETSMVIPSGYYGLNELNQQVRLQLQVLGMPTDLFQFSGDTATQIAFVTYGLAGVYLNFNPADSIKEILGVDSRYSPITAPGVPATLGSVDIFDSIAQFDSVNAFLIICNSIAENGIPINALGTSVLGSVPVDVAPNNLISYSPEQAIWINAPHFIGSSRTDIRFSLVNELLEDVAVIEPFNFVVTIKWTI